FFVSLGFPPVNCAYFRSQESSATPLIVNKVPAIFIQLMLSLKKSQERKSTSRTYLVEIPVAIPTGSFDSDSTKQIEPSAINSPIGAANGRAFVGTVRLPCLIHSAGIAVTSMPIAIRKFT